MIMITLMHMIRNKSSVITFRAAPARQAPALEPLPIALRRGWAGTPRPYGELHADAAYFRQESALVPDGRTQETLCLLQD